MKTRYKKSSMESDSTTATAPLPETISGVVDHLVKAMKEGRAVHVAYANRDPNENRPRKIKPLEWVRYGEKIKVICFLDNIEKNFNVKRIRRIEDNAWATEVTATTKVLEPLCGSMAYIFGS